jgi:DNA invertase Pin-like site-specific DNA recombinase
MSTDQQDLSITLQRAAIRAYGRAHDIEVVKSYEDAGRSGLRIHDRQGMRDLLRDVLEPVRKRPANPS